MASSQRILVTGGWGYIGYVLTKKLLEKGYSVTVLDNVTNNSISNFYQNPNLTIINGDIRKPTDIDNSLEGVESVIHLAAISGGVSGELNKELTKLVNFESFKLLIEEAKNAGVKRFINASTFGVYGNKYKQPLSEDLPVKPVDEYSISKAKSEVIAQQFNSDDFTTTSLRCAMVCGWSPRMRFDLIVNRLTYKAIEENKITIMGGKQKRPQIHIDDLTDYFISLLNLPPYKIAGEIFNAGGQNISIMEIAEIIQKCFNNDIEVVIKPYRKEENSFVLDSTKIARRLNLRPKYSVTNAVLDIIMHIKHVSLNNG